MGLFGFVWVIKDCNTLPAERNPALRGDREPPILLVQLALLGHLALRDVFVKQLADLDDLSTANGASVWGAFSCVFYVWCIEEEKYNDIHCV